MQSACSRHAGGAVANAGAEGAAACGRHAVGVQAGHAGGMQVGRAVANTGAGGAAACSRHAGGAVVNAGRVGCSCVRSACSRRAVGMQAEEHAGGMQVGRAVANAGRGCSCVACSRHAGGAVANAALLQGMQLHAVGMQAACRRGMQVTWRHAGGARCASPNGGSGRQAACRSKRSGPAKIAIQNSTKFG